MVAGGPKTPTGFVQDGPRKGGFPAVNVKRSLPGGGMSSLAMMTGMVFTFAYGMYAVVHANRQRRAITREEGDIRLAITPFLQTESDLKIAFMSAKKVESEAELMKDVKDWEAGASVYKTRYMSPMKVFGLN